MNNQKTGKIGEKYAENYLSAQNYQIFTKNYYCRFGEIDLIAIDQENQEIVFVEVKTRTNSNYGSPEEAITYSKKQKLIKTALQFLASKPLNTALSWRLDLIAVKLKPDLTLIDLRHLKNIFNE